MLKYNFFFLFILFHFLKANTKNFSFSSRLLFLDNFWKYDSLVFKKKNFFNNELSFCVGINDANFFFQINFVNFYLFNKKKYFLKSKRRFLKKLKKKYFKKLMFFIAKKGKYNKKILNIMKKIWYSFEFKFSKNWPLKLYIQQQVKNFYFLNNFARAWCIFDHWKKYQKFLVFNLFRTRLLTRKFRKINFLKFLNFYIRNYKKLLGDPNFKKKKLKYHRSKKFFIFKKFKYLSPRFFPRNTNNFANKFEYFPKKLQSLLVPYGIVLKQNYLNLFNSLKNISLKNLNEFQNQNLFTYFLKFKRKRSNFYFSIFNGNGEIIYYLSSGRFFKLNFRKRNRKLRNSFFSLSLMIKIICRILKKKKIFKINVFIKPYFLKVYIIRRIFFSFFHNGIKLMSVRNLINFPHNRFTKNKKIRRI